MATGAYIRVGLKTEISCAYRCRYAGICDQEEAICGDFLLNFEVLCVDIKFTKVSGHLY